MSLILGLDSGSEESGWCLYDSDAEAILDFGIQPNEQVRALLCALRLGSTMLPKPDMVAIEWVTTNYPKKDGKASFIGKSVFETVFEAGTFAAVWGGPYERIPRQTCKTRVVGKASASDSEVRAALIERFGHPGTKSHPGKTHGITSHAWQALCCALACAIGPVKAKRKPRKRNAA